ncbi:hypothetical protein Pmar_PMAR014920, partial [Perkinsus marinus ATCC 50983]
VLGWSVDNRVQQQMKTRQCDGCENEIYAAALVCPKCDCRQAALISSPSRISWYALGLRYSPCVVTGYPVLASSKVECANCRAMANRDDWN